MCFVCGAVNVVAQVSVRLNFHFNRVHNVFKYPSYSPTGRGTVRWIFEDDKTFLQVCLSVRQSVCLSVSEDGNGEMSRPIRVDDVT